MCVLAVINLLSLQSNCITAILQHLVTLIKMCVASKYIVILVSIHVLPTLYVKHLIKYLLLKIKTIFPVCFHVIDARTMLKMVKN